MIGVGLLGGSLGLALKRRKLADRIEGFVRRPESVQECEKFKVVHKAGLDLSEIVTGADLIVFCTPLSQMKELAEKMRAAVSPGATVTDVGSVKSTIVNDLEPIFARANAHFVGSHPMAGAERTGPSAASEDLFEQAICIITPIPDSNGAAVENVAQLWKSVGGIPRIMSPEIHDQLVGRSSHLPHVLAAELVNFVLGSKNFEAQASVCANGFRDSTRIASSSPEMWRDICLANRENLVKALTGFAGELERFRHALEGNDVKTIEAFFKNAKQKRDEWQSRKSSRSPE